MLKNWIYYQAVDRRSVDVVRMVFFLFFVVVYVVFLCFVGEKVTRQFEEISDCLYQCSWNEFPFKMQKIMPTLLTVTQKPVYIEGFMNVRCTREVFKKVFLTKLLSVNRNYHLSFFLVADYERCVLVLFFATRILMKYLGNGKQYGK